MSSLYAKKFWKTNNHYLADYDKNKGSSYNSNIDPNSVYGGIMHQSLFTSLKRFLVSRGPRWFTETYAYRRGEWVGIYSCDRPIVPEEVHDYFKDYPPAPSKEIVELSALGMNQVQMLGEMAITSLPKVPKLVQSLQRKVSYVLDYLTLQLFVQLGLKITHIHRVQQFRQAKWMSPFVEWNTELRKVAKIRFQENFYEWTVHLVKLGSPNVAEGF